MDRQAGREALVGASGALQHALGAGLELDGGAADVLGLHVVGHCGRVAAHALDLPHHPQQQVHPVHRLVHQRAAAVELPRALPAIRVVALLAPPRHEGVAIVERAQAALLDGRAQGAIAAVGAELVDRRQHDIGFACGGDHRVNVRQRYIHGLGHEAVLARPRGGDGGEVVMTAGGRDVDVVNVVAGQQVVHVRVVGLGAILLGAVPGTLLHDVAGRDELRVRHALERLEMH